MSDWPVGLSTGCFYQTSIFDCLETIRHAGFGMIEISSFPAHLDYHDREAVSEAARLIEELGIEAYSLHAPFASDLDITALDIGHRHYVLQEILQAVDAAAKLKVRWFVLHPGPEESYLPPAEERIQRMENAAKVLNEVARRCQELEIGLVLENMLPHLLFGHTSDMLWLMGALDTIYVGTCLDTGHAYLSGDLHNVMYKLSGHLQMVHAHDNRGDEDEHLPPGDGHIDWEALLEELVKTDFRGAFILELAGNGKPEDLMARARRARLYLRNISRSLDLAYPPTER